MIVQIHTHIQLAWRNWIFFVFELLEIRCRRDGDYERQERDIWTLIARISSPHDKRNEWSKCSRNERTHINRVHARVPVSVSHDIENVHWTGSKYKLCPTVAIFRRLFTLIRCLLPLPWRAHTHTPSEWKWWQRGESIPNGRYYLRASCVCECLILMVSHCSSATFKQIILVHTRTLSLCLLFYLPCGCYVNIPRYIVSYIVNNHTQNHNKRFSVGPSSISLYHWRRCTRYDSTHAFAGRRAVLLV